MAWTLTGSLDEFEAAAGEHLRTDPVRQTVPLTLLATLRERGLAAFGDAPPVYGWHRSAGQVDGAFLQTPPYPVLVASLPAESALSLISLLGEDGRDLSAVNLPGPAEPAFLGAWAAATGGSAATRQRSRLFRLGALAAPDPMPPGAARVAGSADRDVLISWHEAFSREIERGAHGPADRMVDDRLSYGGLMLWEADGRPAAMAGITRLVAGVARVAPVYTPPGHRRRGFGGAVTTAVSQAAIDAGAAEVVLYTDLANPTSNALYQRLGYRPVEERVLLDLLPAPRDQANVTGTRRAPS